MPFQGFFGGSHRKKWLLQPFRTNVIKNNNNHNFYYMKIWRDQPRPLFYRKPNQNQPEFLCVMVLFWCHPGKKLSYAAFHGERDWKKTLRSHQDRTTSFKRRHIKDRPGPIHYYTLKGVNFGVTREKNCLKQPVGETRIGTIPTSQCYDPKGELKEEQRLALK